MKTMILVLKPKKDEEFSEGVWRSFSRALQQAGLAAGDTTTLPANVLQLPLKDGLSSLPTLVDLAHRHEWVVAIHIAEQPPDWTVV